MMDRYIPAKLACVRYLASERTLDLHARRGNLPFRGQEGARLYDAEVLPLLFLPRSAPGAALPPAGTLGTLRMGDALEALEAQHQAETGHRRRRRVAASLDVPASRAQREAQEA